MNSIVTVKSKKIDFYVKFQEFSTPGTYHNPPEYDISDETWFLNGQELLWKDLTPELQDMSDTMLEVCDTTDEFEYIVEYPDFGCDDQIEDD